MQVSAGVILPGSPRRPPKMRLHIDGEGHGAVQYVQNMQNVHHVHRVIYFLSKFVKVGSSGNDARFGFYILNYPNCLEAADILRNACCFLFVNDDTYLIMFGNGERPPPLFCSYSLVLPTHSAQRGSICISALTFSCSETSHQGQRSGNSVQKALPAGISSA